MNPCWSARVYAVSLVCLSSSWLSNAWVFSFISIHIGKKETGAFQRFYRLYTPIGVNSCFAPTVRMLNIQQVIEKFGLAYFGLKPTS
jgi:hypothetical protein